MTNGRVLRFTQIAIFAIALRGVAHGLQINPKDIIDNREAYRRCPGSDTLIQIHPSDIEGQVIQAIVPRLPAPSDFSPGKEPLAVTVAYDSRGDVYYVRKDRGNVPELTLRALDQAMRQWKFTPPTGIAPNKPACIAVLVLVYLHRQGSFLTAQVPGIQGRKK